MWSIQQYQFGPDVENLAVFSPNQYVYPVQHGQGFVQQFDPIAQQYKSASPHQLVYPVYAQDAPQFSEFRDSEQQTFDPTISHQIDFFNRHIAKMLRSAEEERFVDPKFAEWCHGEAKYFMNFRDSIMHNVPTRKYGGVGQPGHSLNEDSPALPAVEVQRVGNAEHRPLMDKSISEVPGMVTGNQIDLPCLEPTNILSTKSGCDDSPLCRDMNSEWQEATSQKAAMDKFVNFDELCEWVDRLKSVPISSKVIPKQQQNFEPDFSFTSLFDLPQDENPNETLPKWFFKENPDRNLVQEVPNLPKIGRITNTISCEWSGNNVLGKQRKLEKEVICQQESGSTVAYRLSSHPISVGSRIVDDVRAKWSKRRLKESVSQGFREFGWKWDRNYGIGANSRGFRWTKRRMKMNFGCGKFGQGIGVQDQSRTIAVFRGAGGVDGERKKERKIRIDPVFDDGMVKWVEERMKRWRTTVRNQIHGRHEESDPGPKRGNSKFDRGRRHFELGLTAGDSAHDRGNCPLFYAH